MGICRLQQSVKRLVRRFDTFLRAFPTDDFVSIARNASATELFFHRAGSSNIFILSIVTIRSGLIMTFRMNGNHSRLGKKIVD